MIAGKLFWGLALAGLWLGMARAESGPPPDALPANPESAVSAGEGEIASDSDEERDRLFNDIATLTEALMLIKKHYVRDKSYREIVYGAIDGMLRDLDPHSGFLEPRDYEFLQEETRGSFSGIGIQVAVRDGQITVIAPLEDSPAFHAGILSGDRIIAIEDTPIDAWPLDRIVEALRGEPGSSVTFTIRRGEEEAFDLTIERADIKLASIGLYGMLDERLGYLRIRQFSESTAEDFRKAIAALEARGMRALVLDLRDNPGGLLVSAVAVAGELLPPDVPVVTTRGRDGDRDMQVIRSRGRAANTPFPPVAVLINRGSASASEIVAGALRDHRRAVLVGERSFGKASVQNVVPLQSNPDCAVRLTTAYYYTPNGELIHEKGIEPDVALPMEPSEWRRAQMRRARIERWDGPVPEGLMDPQLERAVELLTGVLVFQDAPGP